MPEILDILEGLQKSHIIGHKDTMGPFIVRTSYGSKSLLAGGIPDLQFHNALAYLDGPT